jgi:hypothetical protein
MSIFKRTNFRLYLFFFLLTVIFYWDTRDAGFVTDFLGWQHTVDNNSFAEVIHASDRGIKSFYHLSHLEMYTLSKLFGTWGLPWFLVFAALFALNGLLVFLFSEKIFTIFKVKNGFLIAFVGVLCFLLSPYQAEIMVWRASFHYLTAFAMMLGFLHYTLLYLQNPQSKYVLRATALFGCSVFALEFFFITPLLAAVLVLFWQLNFPKTFDVKKTVLRFVGGPLSILGLYLIAYHWVYGKWIGHYGAEAHNKVFTPESFATYTKYIVKHLFFIRYFENTPKTAIFHFFDTPSVSWGIFIGILAFFALSLVFFKKLSSQARLIAFNLAFFSLLIMPVMTLFFATGLLTENDRYGYMASAFLYTGVALALARLGKNVFLTIMTIYLGFSVFFLVKTTSLWFKSERTFTNLIKSYRWWDAEEVLVLNAPDNLEGMYMFRIRGAESAIPEALEAFRRQKVSFKIYDTQRYTLTDWTNGVHIRVNTPDSLTVSFNQFGTWWTREPNYETEQYTVKDGAGNYTLKLKPTTKKRVLLFQVADTWQEVDLTKIGVEQR